jgi:hypothetical protein
MLNPRAAARLQQRTVNEGRSAQDGGDAVRAIKAPLQDVKETAELR